MWFQPEHWFSKRAYPIYHIENPYWTSWVLINILQAKNFVIKNKNCQLSVNARDYAYVTELSFSKTEKLYFDIYIIVFIIGDYNMDSSLICHCNINFFFFRNYNMLLNSYMIWTALFYLTIFYLQAEGIIGEVLNFF